MLSGCERNPIRRIGQPATLINSQYSNLAKKIVCNAVVIHVIYLNTFTAGGLPKKNAAHDAINGKDCVKH